MKAPDEKNLIVVVPENLHKKLKVHAAENSTSVSAIVRKALADAGFKAEEDEKWSPLKKSV
jgi:plasmid stability protein